MIRTLIAWSAPVILLMAIGTVAARGPADGNVVSGSVSGDDAGYLPGARITMQSPRRETRTDADGRFTFADVPDGRRALRVSADGYLLVDTVVVVAGTSAVVDIVLHRADARVATR